MRSIDLDSLEIFRAVVAEGGVIRAAGKLNRVQSNVTTRIKPARGAARRASCSSARAATSCSSPAGRRLLPYAERLLRLADEAESELRSDLPLGTFRLGSLESTAGSRLPPLLSRYHKLLPGVVVELVTGTTGALIGRVNAFEVEAAFISEPFSAPGLETLPVFEEALVLITARGCAPVAAPPICAARP